MSFKRAKSKTLNILLVSYSRCWIYDGMIYVVGCRNCQEWDSCIILSSCRSCLSGQDFKERLFTFLTLLYVAGKNFFAGLIISLSLSTKSTIPIHPPSVTFIPNNLMYIQGQKHCFIYIPIGCVTIWQQSITDCCKSFYCWRTCHSVSYSKWFVCRSLSVMNCSCLNWKTFFHIDFWRLTS